MEASQLCLTIPGRVIAVKDKEATVDYGKYGIRENASTKMVPVKLGDYVLVQGGFVIKVLPPQEAEESLRAWDAIQDELGPDGGLF